MSEEKRYYTSDIRRPFKGAPDVGVRRHKLDLEFVTGVAAAMPGGTYGGESLEKMAEVLRQADNCHEYGTDSSNMRDRRAINKVMRAYHSSEPAVLSPYEAAHVAAGASFLAAHKAEFTDAFIAKASEFYEFAVDESGRKVVDRRTLRK